jgi:two-component system NtrC family sensor kinase
MTGRNSGKPSTPSNKADTQLRRKNATLEKKVTELLKANAELQKQQSEEKFRKVFMSSPAALSIHDHMEKNRLVDVNRAWEKATGYQRHEVIGFNPLEFGIVPDSRVRDEIFRLMKEEGSFRDLEINYRKKNGDARVCLMSGVIIELDAKQYMLAAYTDITGRKEAERELEENERMLARAQQMAHVGHWDRYLATGKARWSDETYRIFGLEPQEREVNGRFLFDRIHPSDRASVKKAVKDAVENVRPYNETYRLVRPDGSIRWVHALGEVTRTQDGKPVRIFGTILDITERKYAEETLRESEVLQRTLLANLPAGVVIIDRATRKIENVNNAGAAMFGARVEVIVGNRCHSFLCPASEGACPVCDLGQQVDKSEREIICADGSRRRVLKSVNLVRIQGQEKLLECFADITDLKQAEEELRKQEVRFRKIFEESPIGMVMAGADYHFIRANRAFCRMTQYTEKEMNSLTFSDITHPDHVEQDIAGVRDLVNGKIPLYRTEKRYIRKDGETVWGACTVALVNDKGGEFLYFLTMIEDITERRRAEDEQAKLWSAVERAGEGVFMVTPDDNRFTYVNSAFCKAYGLSREELVEKSTAILRSDRHPQSFHDAIWSELEKGKTWSGRQTRKRKDGTPIEVETTIAPVRDASGTIIHYVGVERDITEQLRTESQLRQAQKMEAIGTLAGGVAHDFNNILAVIMGLANLIQMTIGPDDRNRPYIDQIVLSSEKAADLTQSLLAFSRKQRITLEPHNLGGIVASTSKLLKRLLPEDIELKLDLADDAVALLDVSQIDQVLMNLSTNARDAMPSGGSITIRTDRAKLDRKFRKIHGFGRPGEYVHLSVSDTGIGMDEKTMARIFDPFFTTKEVGKGTGLGLASVYGIVKQHNGYITVTSGLLKGTTFDIYLPLVEATVETEPAAGAGVTGGSETILVLEDDRAVRNMIINVLSVQGYTTLEAANGEEAIRVYNEHKDKIRLVILDVVMPGRNGKEVLDEIARINPAVKAIFISGYAGDIVLDKGVGKDNADFLQKPLSMPKLLGKVREVLDG